MHSLREENPGLSHSTVSTVEAMPAMAEPITHITDLDRETLVQAILDLENGHPSPVPDPLIAYQLAHHVKPYINRLTASPEEPLDDDGEELTIGSLAAEVELIESQDEVEDKQSRRKRTTGGRSPHRDLHPELEDLSAPERARWIFMDRYISLEKHQEVLGYTFAEEDFARYQQDLEDFLDQLLALPDTILPAENGDIPALQKIFASTLLIFRNPFIGDEEGNPIPCNLENLRHRFQDYFYKRRNTPNWYEHYDFYTAPLPQPRWVLCEIDYLNCTLRNPRKRLAGYAHRWHIDEEAVSPKTVLEDVYDRVLTGEALGEDLFEQNCNACTSTIYTAGSRGHRRMVYTVQRNRKITIHGKPGLPHWRASRRLWPGVFPTLLFS